MNLFIDGKKRSFGRTRLLATGGEAEVFDLGDGRVFKRFKTASHPDFAHDPALQQSARDRLEEHTRKLPTLLARSLPDAAVKPSALAYDASGALLGYLMPKITDAEVLARFGDRGCVALGVSPARACEVLLSVHAGLSALHGAGVIVGDLNDHNLLVGAAATHWIDVDSYQFDGFASRVFSERFADPTHCALGPHDALTLTRPHDAMTDWYAFAVLVMQTLLWVGPYGGVYRDPKRKLTPQQRPFERLTVFDARVVYPKPARPIQVLPDALLHELQAIFVRDERRAFPEALLHGLRFCRCLGCGAEHARAVCPMCASARLGVRPVMRGTVKARTLWQGEALLLGARMTPVGLRTLRLDGGRLLTEDGVALGAGAASPLLSFDITSRHALVRKGAQLALLGRDGSVTRRTVNQVATNGTHVVYVADGKLTQLAGCALTGEDRVLGEVVDDDLRLWLGPRFGLAVYRVAALSVGVVFRPGQAGLNDSLRLPDVRGRVVAMECVFSETHAWLLIVRQENGQREHVCLLLDATGKELARVTARDGDLPWLHSVAGAAAVASTLFVPTDDGLVRVEPYGHALVVTREFPDTAPFVHSGCRLVLGADSIIVCDAHEVRALTMEAP